MMIKAATIALVLLVTLATGPVLAQGATARSAQPCSQACLLQRLSDVKAALLARQTVPLAPNAEVRQNMVVTTIDQSAWKDVKSIKSSLAFADATTGNVVSRDGVELSDGKPGYLSTRLKIVDGQITEVEFSADLTRARPEYVWNLPDTLSAVLPEAQRSTREALDALAHRYFQGLTDHKPVAADFDDARCNRFHSGVQVTNVARNTIEGGGAVTCFGANNGPRPWGPALEQRFPIIDPERGVVMGLTLLMYADRVMYVSEIFKIDGAKIVHIDNIGIMVPGLDHTTGFGTRK